MNKTNPRWLISKAPKDLKAQIRIAVEYGYQLTNQTSTTAQLIRNKKFSCLFASLGFLLAGIGAVIYVFYYLAKRDEVIYLDVESQPTKEELALAAQNSPWKAIFNKKTALYAVIGLFCLYLLGAIFSLAGGVKESQSQGSSVPQQELNKGL